MKEYISHKSTVDWDNMKFLNPGDKVYYPMVVQNIIVQATVEECNDIYSTTGPQVLPIWVHRFQDSSKDYASVATDQKDELGWPIYEHKPLSYVENLKRVNQFLWIDEPVGHGIQVGDECFLTLFEARNCVFPSNAKHLRCRLKSARNRTMNFIKSTWGPGGVPYEEHMKLYSDMKQHFMKDKRVYVRNR